MSDVIVVEQPQIEIVGTLENLVVIERGDPVVVISVGSQGPPGVDGTGDSHYVHDQMIAAATWTVVHNLAKYPSVIVFDSSGAQCEGAAAYDSTNQLTLTFSSAFGGKAYIN